MPVTATVSAVTVRETVSMQGVLLRDELILYSDGQSAISLRTSGESVARGEVLATLSQTANTDSNFGQTATLELQLIRAEASEHSSDLSVGVRASVEAQSVSDYHSAISQSDVQARREAVAVLEGLYFGTERETWDIERELGMISAMSYIGDESLLAPESGIFFPYTDGLEDVYRPESVYVGLTEELLARTIDNSSQAYGKLVVSPRWYLLGELEPTVANGLTLGETVEADLGSLGVTELRVEQLSFEAEGLCAVLFSGNLGTSEILSAREVEAELETHYYSGLSVPIRAVRLDESGASYVYTETAGVREKKYVETIYVGDEMFVVSASTDEGALRVGDTLIVSG